MLGALGDQVEKVREISDFWQGSILRDPTALGKRLAACGLFELSTIRKLILDGDNEPVDLR